MIEISRYKNKIFSALFLLAGGLILAFIPASFFNIYTSGYLSGLSDQQLASLSHPSAAEIFTKSFRIYIISYVLFSLLPPPISKARTSRRILYFTLFYLLCYFIYLLI